MPPMAFCTAGRPDSAACSDWRATWAVSCACADTSLIRPAICSTDSPVSRISRSCSVDAASSSVDVASTCCVVSRHAARRALHLRHQRAQLFHRVVHRVGDGAGDVFGHRGLLRQVAFGHRLQFVHQSQNGRLVGVVDALGFLLLALGFQRAALRRSARVAPGPARTAAGRPMPPTTIASTDSSISARWLMPDAGLLADSLLLQRLQALAQRLAVVNDARPALRARTPGPAGCPGSAPACVRVSLVLLDQLRAGARGSAGPWCRAGAARGCRRAGPAAISRKEFKSLPSRNTASGLTPSIGQEFVGATCRCAASASPAGRRRTARPAGRSAAASATTPSRRFPAGRTTGG